MTQAVDQDLVNVLLTLDPENNDHWTDQGAPAIEPIRVALDRVVTRKEVTTAAPDLTRETFGAFVESVTAEDNDQQDDGELELSTQPVEKATDNELLQERDFLTEDMNRADEYITQAQQERFKIETRLNAVLNEIEGRRAKVNPMQSVLDHIAASKRDRAERILGPEGVASVLDATFRARPRVAQYTQGDTVPVT